MKKSALILAVLAATACKGQNLAELPSDSLRIQAIGHHIEQTGDLRENVTFFSAMLLGFGTFLSTRPEKDAKEIGWGTMVVGGGAMIAFQFDLSRKERKLGRALQHRYTE